VREADSTGWVREEIDGEDRFTGGKRRENNRKKVKMN
jgi:hypothetical protein